MSPRLPRWSGALMVEVIAVPLAMSAGVQLRVTSVA
jgi:hypothetical protein